MNKIRDGRGFSLVHLTWNDPYVDPVLPEKVIQFLLPAADTVGIPAGQPQGFSPRRPSRPCCHIQLRKGQLF